MAAEADVGGGGGKDSAHRKVRDTKRVPHKIPVEKRLKKGRQRNGVGRTLKR